MKEKNKKQMIKYWDVHHNLKLFRERKKDPLGLDIICVTGMPFFYNKLLHFFNMFNLKKLLKPIKPLDNKYILDIGCGTGRWCRYFVSQHTHVTGIDLSYSRIKDNRERINKGNFLVASATDLSFKDNTYDLVTSIVVLQHINYDMQREVVSEIYRVLKPGGYFLMIESTKEDESITYNYSFPHSTRQWISFFEGKGFEIIATSSSGYFFLVSGYLHFKEKIRSWMYNNPKNEKNKKEVNPYDSNSLLNFQKSILTLKLPWYHKILKKIDYFLFWIIVKVSYPLEFFNYY